MSEDTQEKLIDAEEAEVLNRKTSAVLGSYFRAMATLTDEEIYKIAYTEAGKDSVRLLDLVNLAYTDMLAAGGDLPCGHFDYYKNLITNMNNTIVYNLQAKFDSNRDTLIAIATGKIEEPEKLSYNDIINALMAK